MKHNYGGSTLGTVCFILIVALILFTAYLPLSVVYDRYFKTEWTFVRGNNTELHIKGHIVLAGNGWTVFKTSSGAYLLTNFYWIRSLKSPGIGDGKITQVWTCKESIDYPNGVVSPYWTSLFKEWAKTDPYFKSLANRYDTSIK